jgi:hypothetical protein
MAQLIVIDQVFVPERDSENPLRHHSCDRVLDLDPGTTVVEADGEPLHQADRPIVAPSNNAPASEVASPPSKAATAWRLSTTS